MTAAILGDAAMLRPRRAPLRRRYLAKAVSWRIVGSFDTLILSMLLLTFLGPLLGIHQTLGHHAATSASIAATEVITKILLYYAHEWLWARLPAGLRRDARRNVVEAHWRSGVKAFTWRLAASLDTTLLAFIFTGNLTMALSIGGAEVATKLILYYLHERAWGRIRYGLPRHD